jgi:hypothetical protein
LVKQFWQELSISIAYSIGGHFIGCNEVFTGTTGANA